MDINISNVSLRYKNNEIEEARVHFRASSDGIDVSGNYILDSETYEESKSSDKLKEITRDRLTEGLNE